jgi:hypothetical protein
MVDGLFGQVGQIVHWIVQVVSKHEQGFCEILVYFINDV